MTKDEAFDVILTVAQEVAAKEECDPKTELTRVLGTIFGCASRLEDEEDDRK